MAVREDEEIEAILEDIIKQHPRGQIFYIEEDLFLRACMIIWDGSLPKSFVFQQREFRPKDV